ncbi:MAG: TIGR02556 family CRISPR-associated protein [Ectobacillus sp.]
MSMQEAIYQLGKAIYQKQDFLLHLVEELPCSDYKGQPLFIAKLNFDTRMKKIDVDCKEQITNQTAAKYLYTGNPKANSPQFVPVLKGSVQPLLTQLFYQWNKRPLSMAMQKKIDSIIEDYFDYLPHLKGTERKFSYIFSPKKACIGEGVPQQLARYAAPKEVATIVAEQFEQFIEKACGIPKAQIGLYVIMIDGEPLSQSEDYKRMLLKEIKLRNSQRAQTVMGFCSLCRTKTELSFDTSKLAFKFYTTNQLSFASGLRAKNYSKNMLLCKDCLNVLVVGEKFIKQHLKKRLGKCSVYLLPQALFADSLTNEQWQDTYENVANIYDLACYYNRSRRYLLDAAFAENCFFNMLFYKDSQQAVKVQKLVKGIAPARFVQLIQAAVRVEERFMSYFTAANMWGIDLKKVYYLTPVRESGGQMVEYRKLLEIYEAVLKREALPVQFFIEQALKMARVVYFKQTNQYNIGEQAVLHIMLLQYQAYISWLREIGCLKEENKMIVEKLYIEKEINDYAIEMKFTKEQTALFLLGILVGRIGAKQHGGKGGRQPVLQKLNFHGLDKMNLLSLSSIIVSLLEENNMLAANEMIYAEHKRLLDQYIGTWSMSKQEALYYVLSGYAFAVQKSFMVKKGDEQNEQ